MSFLVSGRIKTHSFGAQTQLLGLIQNLQLMLILGLNAHHGDSAACLLRDGQLIAAAEEERFRRVKHWAGFPIEAATYCLSEGGVALEDLDHIAINRKPGINLGRKLSFVFRHLPDCRLVFNRLRNICAASSVSSTLSHALGKKYVKARTHHIEHHLAHMASAYLVSNFDQAVCVSLDGLGDFASAAWGFGVDRSITIHGRIYFPHSLGIFYTAISQFLGFPNFGDEYKVMGLAPYGKPRFLPQMQELVQVLVNGTYQLNLKYFRHHKENVPYSWQGCAPEVGWLATPALESLLGLPRKPDEPIQQIHRDLACSAQAMFEKALFALLNALYLKYRCSNLALSGGCAMNSVANGKVHSASPFRNLYLPPAANDAGGAIGAAFVVWYDLAAKGAVRSERMLSPKPGEPLPLQNSTSSSCRTKAKQGKTARSHRTADLETLQTIPNASSLNHTINDHKANFVMRHAYVGPGFDREHIRDFLRGRREELTGQDCTVESMVNEQELCARTAQAIAAGLVVGWFQGRMEWGPRALGNRSILCDPRRADMKDILNRKIKRRESFRPFAPSVLREHVRHWFEHEADVPFMMQVFQVRQEKRGLVPATTHVDGSGRLQTVNRETNALYHRLISEFHSLTGVPMLLNTSFNENEPVVCRPEEALDCFLRTRMDVLVMDHFYIQRQSSCAA